MPTDYDKVVYLRHTKGLARVSFRFIKRFPFLAHFPSAQSRFRNHYAFCVCGCVRACCDDQCLRTLA